MQLTRATYSEALTLLRFGLAVRRASWGQGEYVRRHHITGPVPTDLPDLSGHGETITRWYPSAEDVAATDWEDANWRILK